MNKFLLLSLPATILLSATISSPFFGSAAAEDGTVLTTPRRIETKSNFQEKEVIRVQEIKFKTEYVANPEKEADLETITRKGVAGKRREVLVATTWLGKSLGERLKKREIIEPQNEIVERGTRVSWKEISVGGQVLKYWKKLNVRATSYDGNCKGCLGRTWAGTDVKIGVCAVDPKVISLGTSFYVPGYGPCHAEDIGGLIKGKHIDLGFPDVKNGFWSARFTAIYLLDGEPKT